MDLLLEQENISCRLTDLGVYNIVVSDGSPVIEVAKRDVKGRHGFIHDGVRFSHKSIKVTGRLMVSSIREFHRKRDELNGLLFTDRPFYITKLVPLVDSLYQFELPGQRTGDFPTSQTSSNRPWHYRYLVLMDSEIEFSFIGRSTAGLKYDVRLSFVTAESPFGETAAKTQSLSGGVFPYKGTAEASQLETPFVVELVATGGQTHFYLEIDGRRWTYEHGVTNQAGDKYLISALGTTLNGNSVTARTNYNYFVIRPNQLQEIPYRTDFRGSIRLLDFKEFYR
ncbi:phage tail domain-containing protein [Streptococcus cuniculipharyngis]|uniref:Phage tail protein n=1 Tax=Streptococcus cuniculipharyngis TaxID=1562651 RepID=A0A5C5SDG2_9STRE|nr:phage tail domain-containing protein [Streptococcus cuniculipharyngis]TWS99137.1 phage tail protein [Streptococcus cuniculipharyngis]